MPVRDRTNNRILPANARAADVAEKAIQEIIPVQQRRYYDAFRPQGITCVHYNRLDSGRKCPCQTVKKTTNGILNEAGKADAGTINRLLTGTMSFDVTGYNQNQDRVIPGTNANGWTSPQAPANKYQGVFDIGVEDSADQPFDHEMDDGLADNGPVGGLDIEELALDFDASSLGFGSVSCPICFGTGFIGGYAPFHAHRSVLTVHDCQYVGETNMTEALWRARTPTGFTATITLPRGAIGVDVFRVWNKDKPVTAKFKIDTTPINGVVDILTRCDGLRHTLQAVFDDEFTHFEMQFNLTTESVYFEFPRRPSSNDTALLEQMEPFQIIMSPNVPMVDSEDIIVESQLGKVLIVQNSNPWNSRQRNVLGWELQVRVVQPMELYRLLPARGRVPTKDRTTQMIRDNVTGYRRT